MYDPDPFRESRPAELFRLIREHPLGMLVTHSSSGLEANHLPFLLVERGNEVRALQAHVARANRVWQDMDPGSEVLVVFRGSEGYVSPSWYPSKHETHRHVPTWNYEVVHAHGRVHVHDDERFVRSVVARLTRVHEAGEACPWQMSDAPKDFLAEELAQIVGIEIELTRLEGKRKLSQNRTPSDFEGAVRALEERGRADLAKSMRDANRGPAT